MQCKITDKGIQIGRSLHEYDSIDAYSIDKEGMNHLYLKSKKKIIPLIITPLGDMPEKQIEEILSKKIKKEKINLPISHIIMDRLGF